MKGDIKDNATLGLVHHMLHSESISDPAEHARSLAEFSRRSDIGTFDCCLPYDTVLASKVAAAVRSSGKKDICFAIHLFPLRKLSFASSSYSERAQTRTLVKELVSQAAEIGATGFIFASGGPPRLEATSENFERFREFCHWLCAELKPHGITALLEPFDFTIDKKFLYGPTKECVALIESLRPETDNLAIELDFAHLPLMGEDFEEAVRTVAPYLERVHLGNCVLKEKANPRYGDTHPPIGYPGGEIDVTETARILRVLHEIGFIGESRMGNLLVEMTVWPGWTVEETVADAWRRLDLAWEMA